MKFIIGLRNLNLNLLKTNDIANCIAVCTTHTTKAMMKVLKYHCKKLHSLENR